MDAFIADMGRRALGGEALTRGDILGLAQRSSQSPYDLLYWANKVRTARFGNAVKLCAIVPGKLGNCGEDCKWCAQSAVCSDPAVKPRRTPVADIIQAARTAAAARASSIGIVNSGRGPAKADLRALVDAADRIRDELQAFARPIRICASLGELTDEQAELLASAGVARYNHNLETSRTFYPTVVTTHGYDDRIRTLQAARKAGLSLCCGGIFGLGETWDDRADLILTLRDEIRPDVIPLNFLHPIPGTPLAGMTPLPPQEILSIIAVFRLAIPQADLKIAGGRQKNLRDLQSWMFYAGGTSCLVGNYLTTTGRPPEEDLQMIADLGLEVAVELPTARPVKTLQS